MKEIPPCRIVCQNIRGGPTKRKGKLNVLLALALAVCSAVLNSGCVPRVFTTCPGPAAGSDEFLMEKVVFEGVTLKSQIAEEKGLLESETFWFSASDSKTVHYGWTKAFYQAHLADASTCNYETPSEGCQQCDMCWVDPRDGTVGVKCNDGNSGGFVLAGVPFGELSEINEQGNPVQIQPILPTAGCIPQTAFGSLPSFSADKETDYILRLGDPCGKTVSSHRFSAKAVGTARPAEKYKLEQYSNDDDPALRFTFKMAKTADGKLLENFSTTLRVTKVRVLLGKTDSTTGGEMLMEDNETLKKWHPSRILFLPDFIEGHLADSSTARTNRCFLDASRDDGGFNLQNCRYGVDQSGEVISRPFNVTPTYMLDRNNETLTWVIEYKLEWGLTELPALKTDEFLVLELTIE